MLNLYRNRYKFRRACMRVFGSLIGLLAWLLSREVANASVVGFVKTFIDYVFLCSFESVI